MFSAIHLEYRQDVAYGLNLNIEDLFFLNALMKTKTQNEIGKNKKIIRDENNDVYYLVDYNSMYEFFPLLFNNYKVKPGIKNKTAQFLHGNLSKILDVKVIDDEFYFKLRGDFYSKLLGY